MFDFLQNIFESAGFLPRGSSFFWNPFIMAMNVVGDGLVLLAYLFIPPIIFFISKRRKELSNKRVAAFFCVLVFFFALYHLTNILTLWLPVYRLQGLVKILTGLIAFMAVLLLYRSIPALIRIPGQKRLEEVNIKLRMEVAERERAQIALRQANEALETRVQQRTAQLIKINRELEREIELRKKADQGLRNTSNI